MKILYYDCFAGISGDMNLGAMIDLGVDPEHLKKELAKLPVSGYELVWKRDSRREVTGVKADVMVAVHEHHHEHHHEHEHGRSYGDIKVLIKQSDLSPAVKDISLRIFEKIATAEGKIHGKNVEDIHFHEVGAVDSIVDIVGAAVCFETLGADKILSGPVELGSGFVKCAHGTFPVPAPATAEILRGIPVKTGAVPFEAATPTGAAIIAVMAEGFGLPPGAKIEKVGYGLGTRDGEVPNVLRVYLLEIEESTVPGKDRKEGTIHDMETAEAFLVECNLDDMVPERYEHVLDLLFQAGAFDAYLTPIIMKKGRPAVTLSVLCGGDTLPALRDILLFHTTTIGLRQYPVAKWMLPRREVVRKTPYGEVRVKQALANGRVLREKPEYDDLKKLAKEYGVSIDRIVAALPRGEDGE